jgi:hypothetical protein
MGRNRKRLQVRAWDTGGITKTGVEKPNDLDNDAVMEDSCEELMDGQE